MSLSTVARPAPGCGAPARSGPCVLLAGHPGRWHRGKPLHAAEEARARLAPAQRPPSTAWMARAACHGTDPEVFFAETTEVAPGPGDDAYAAVRACLACPVRLQCLDFALAMGETHAESGVWGGLTPPARRWLARQQRRAAS